MNLKYMAITIVVGLTALTAYDILWKNENI
ncbi:MAG: hypothetical protein GBAus27B_000182 [Mycoplasmataceae bacterium]|nr:MAG: hypothetical protein GBAus27B_000182 [Mycoplasmataceae bacterium]